MPFIWSAGFLFPFSVFLIGGSLILFSNSSFLFSVYVFEVSYDSFFVMDFLSLLFFVVVGVVSTAVLTYSVDYMMDSPFKKKFMITMVVFILSMFVLAMSADLFWVMVGWDGLGLSSLGLIMYFQNWKSFNSSMVTFLSNRVGDAFILLSLIWLMSFGLSKSSISLTDSLFIFLLVFGAFSKSAQVPFSAWLPLAMAAPTPVSSLVHSSTLVTAGVYLLVRFKNFLSENEKFFIFILSSVTIFLSASSSMGEYDLKKIIALSTLSHIGLMMMFISLSSFFSVLIHLHSHAMFKSLLFMIAGDLIHKKYNTQDIRSLNMSSIDYPTGVSLIVSLLSMIGFPFLAGFFSKELFLCYVSGQGLEKMVVFFFAASLTSSYSFRILFTLLSNESVSLAKTSFSPNWKIFSIMSIFSTMSGGVMFLLSKTEGLENFPLIPFFFFLKKEIFLFLIFGGGIGALFSLSQGKMPSLFLKWIHFMWWVSGVCFFFQKNLFHLSWSGLFKMDSKGFIDSISFEKKDLMENFSKDFLQFVIPFPLILISLSLVGVGGLSLLMI